MSDSSDFRLDDGSRIAVIGGGPAGAFFAYFALDMAAQAGRKIEIDIYEPRDFFHPGPGGCNMCAGIVSERLGEMLAAEGIPLPPTVVRQDINSYVLHMDVGSARIDTPRQGKRINAVYRGAGPRDSETGGPPGLDGHLLSLALDKGDAIQVFLLQIPGLEFGMLIPKREYITVCLLGEEIDKDLVQAFLDAPEVQACLPAGLGTARFSCQCSPRINIRAAHHPYADRVVFIGDCSATRLFKDGIGSAYRTARVAASTAILQGVSDADFERHYRPVLEAIEADNDVGRFILKAIAFVQKQRFARQAMLRMVLSEQGRPSRQRRMSTIQWDMYTGSGTYRQILLRMLHPAFLSRLTYHLAASLLSDKMGSRPTAATFGDGMGELSDALVDL